MNYEREELSRYTICGLKSTLGHYKCAEEHYNIELNKIKDRIKEILEELERRKEFKHGDIVEFHLISCSAPEKRILLSIDNGPLKAYDKNGLCVAGLQDIVNQENYGACYTVIGNVFDGE